MIYLDTHAVAWLYAGLTEKFTAEGRQLINENDIMIATIVRLELLYLHEVGRLTVGADIIVADLAARLGLSICEKPWNQIVSRALSISWTRDPFERLIVANAALQENRLLTRDRTIGQNYPLARW